MFILGINLTEIHSKNKPSDSRISEQKIKILNLLENEGELGLNISQIAEKIQLNRNSTAKYLELMSEASEIHKIEQGPTRKLYYPNRISQSIEERKDYSLSFYQLLHKILFKKNSKKARIAGEKMAPEAAKIYLKRFGSEGVNFQKISSLISMAVEITYPIANAKVQVKLNPENENSFLIDIPNCICNGNPEYFSICEIQTGLFKGILNELIFPNEVKVKEIECKCKDHPSCKYEITKIMKKK